MTTTVILIRHESREGADVPMNCLTQAARDRAFRSGRKLRESGYKINVAYSSPQFRAIETLQWILAGNGEGDVIPLSGTNEAFGDAKLGKFRFSKEVIDNLKTESKKTGVGVEELLLKNDASRPTLLKRGKEGAVALFKILEANRGKIIAVASHGGSRLEPIIMDLRIERIWKFDWTFAPGSAAIIEFDDNFYTIGKPRYLGNLGKE